MRDWLRTGAGSPPAPVRRDTATGPTAPPARPAGSGARLRRLPEVIFLSITVLLLAGAVALSEIEDSTASEPPLSTTASVPSGARPAEGVVEPQAPPPRRVSIDHLGIDSTLAPLEVAADGSLEVPADYDRAGWHRAGTAPGNTGPAVIVGHVDSVDGPAVFHRLRELTAGDRLSVTRVDGSQVIFEVYALERYSKDAFPTDAVYGPTSVPELRLVTCGGAFDESSRSYADNVVAYARVAAAAPAQAPGTPS